MVLLRPNDVFVPGKFPTHQSNVYTDRKASQRELDTAIARGFVPIVFGSYGVGKSSLAMRYAGPWADNGALVYVPTAYRLTLRAVLERVLEHLGYEVTVSRDAHKSRKGKGEAGFESEAGSILLKATFKGTISREWERGGSEHSELAIRTPSDTRIIELCESNGLFLMIDELQRATARFSRDLAAFLKAYSNMNCKRFKICLIGTEDDASGLVIMDKGIDRVLHEVHVPALSEHEAEDIVIPGMRRLGIHISDDIVENIVRAGVGSPFIVQYLCLEVAERARAESIKAVEARHFEHALSTYVRRKAQRQIRAYKAAVETVGPKRLRKQILIAMAHTDDEYVTMDYLVEQVSRQLGEPVPSTTLSGPLRELKERKYGQILRDVDDPMGIGRVYNYSAFSDPATKSVIRLVERLGLDAAGADHRSA